MDKKKPSHSVLDSHSSHQEEEDLPSSPSSGLNSPKPPPSSPSSPTELTTQDRNQEALKPRQVYKFSDLVSSHDPKANKNPQDSDSQRNIPPLQSNSSSVPTASSQPPQDQRDEQQTHCKCQHSECLTLLCDCFATGSLCNNGCNCLNCHNNSDNETKRQEAVKKIKKRDQPYSFLPLAALKMERDEQQRHCKCQKSKCLKLYCDCFASGSICNDGCDCLNCHNNSANEANRVKAIIEIKDRNPDAFKPEIGLQEKLSKGCICKKSKCLMKFCVCYEAKVLCSENCRCRDCENSVNERTIQKAIDAIKARNLKQSRGCKCTRSECLMKSCACFAADGLCTKKCRCRDCNNYKGSEERNRRRRSRDPYTAINILSNIIKRQRAEELIKPVDVEKKLSGETDERRRYEKDQAKEEKEETGSGSEISAEEADQDLSSFSSSDFLNQNKAETETNKDPSTKKPEDDKDKAETETKTNTNPSTEKPEDEEDKAETETKTNTNPSTKKPEDEEASLV